MSLLFWDGLDHYANNTDLRARAGVVQYANSSGGPATGRNGNGKKWTGNLYPTFFQRIADQFIGASLTFGGSDVFVYCMDTVANDVQVVVIFRIRNFTIEVWRGNQVTLLYRSANNAWATNTDNFVEVRVKVDSSVGTVKVSMLGTVLVNLTGQNTKQTANATWDQAQIIGPDAIDDFYYGDTTTGSGSFPCNDFLGDIRSYTSFPTSNGTVQWTAFANANWQEVSEVAFDGDASYNLSSTVNQQDLFNIGAVPTSISGILGFQITAALRKDDAGARTVANVLKSGATTSVGTARSMTDTNYVYWSEQFILDPNTAANWTRANINAAQIGYKVIS